MLSSRKTGCENVHALASPPLGFYKTSGHKSADFIKLNRLFRVCLIVTEKKNYRKGAPPYQLFQSEFYVLFIYVIHLN